MKGSEDNADEVQAGNLDCCAEQDELITEGVAPRKAAAQTSREFGGAPAAGIIMNRYNNGWRVKGAVSNGHTEVTALKDELKEARREIARLTRERAAHAEGAVEVLRDVAELNTNGHALNGNGHPAI